MYTLSLWLFRVILSVNSKNTNVYSLKWTAKCDGPSKTNFGKESTKLMKFRFLHIIKISKIKTGDVGIWEHVTEKKNNLPDQIINPNKHILRDVYGITRRVSKLIRDGLMKLTKRSKDSSADENSDFLCYNITSESRYFSIFTLNWRHGNHNITQ